MVLKQLRDFERSSEVQDRVGERINKLVKDRKEWSGEFVSKGRKFTDSLGGNGVYAAADEIKQVLTANGFY